MSLDARPIRGYRPSQYGGSDDGNGEMEQIRQANLALYVQRASVGLPIFEEPRHPVNPLSTSHTSSAKP